MLSFQAQAHTHTFTNLHFYQHSRTFYQYSVHTPTLSHTLSIFGHCFHRREQSNQVKCQNARQDKKSKSSICRSMKSETPIIRLEINSKIRLGWSLPTTDDYDSQLDGRNYIGPYKHVQIMTSIFWLSALKKSYTRNLNTLILYYSFRDGPEQLHGNSWCCMGSDISAS